MVSAATTPPRSSPAGRRCGRPSAPGRSPTTATARSVYVLEMLPYPSGEPHIGHLKNYSIGDAVAHFRRRRGREVLHPIGYDAFGLPAENHAIATGVHPRDSTAASIAAFQRDFRRWGISFDWSREFGTHEPRYYRWTQWIFLQLLRGRPRLPQGGGRQLVPERRDRARQRAGDRRALRALRRAVVELRQLEQWFFRITDYAQRLLDDLDTIDWPEHVKTMQRNWIGRSEGAEVIFRCEELGDRLPGVHDAPRHAVRRDVLRDGARAPRRADARGRHRARGGGARVRQPRADRAGAGSRRRREAEDRRPARAHRHATRSTASRSRCSSPTTC